MKTRECDGFLGPKSCFILVNRQEQSGRFETGVVDFQSVNEDEGTGQRWSRQDVDGSWRVSAAAATQLAMLVQLLFGTLFEGYKALFIRSARWGRISI